MGLDPMSIFTTWLGIFSISFTFMPVGLILDWKKRGTADGFSSVNFVLPFLVTSLWLKHGFLTNDNTNITINTANICLFVFYLLAFAYYQPKRKYLIGQLIVGLAVVKSVYYYVDAQDEAVRADTMGSIAAAAQVLANAGGIYEIMRVIRMGHTEYLPAVFQYALFTLMAQWMLFGYLTDNVYIMWANVAGLVVNLTTISLYFKYPPLTWRVPIIGTGPQQKKKDD